jgi:nitronate monooxygenase
VQIPSSPTPAAIRGTRLTRHAGIDVPLICGAMYPCSNPELVAAVSEAGGLGIIQPLSLVYVHGHEFRAGLRLIRGLTHKPVGLNVLTERALSKVYRERMQCFLDIALEEGVRFFVTALGDPRWVVERAHQVGGVVYHDVVDRRWALRGLEAGVDGLICVNGRAGGHAGSLAPEALREQLGDLGVPLVCAGGVGTAPGFAAALAMGYDGVQMGTRFIATPECHTQAAYKQAIVAARAEDIVLTERVTGVPLAVIRTPHVERVGTKAGPFGRFMLRGQRTKHWMRALYSLRSAWALRRATVAATSSKDYWQAGRSVEGITSIEPAGAIVRRCAEAWMQAGGAAA